MTERQPQRAAGPFGILKRFADEIDSVFDDFGLGRSWLAPRLPEQVTRGGRLEIGEGPGTTR